MDTAAAGNDDRAFTGYQTFRPFLGVAEGDAGASHRVEIVFQLRRDVEVVHRRSDNNHIVAFQFGDQLVGKGQRFLLTRSQRRVARTQGANQFAIQNRDRIGGGSRTVISSPVFFLPLFNKIVGKLTRL